MNNVINVDFGKEDDLVYVMHCANCNSDKYNMVKQEETDIPMLVCDNCGLIEGEYLRLEE